MWNKMSLKPLYETYKDLWLKFCIVSLHRFLTEWGNEYFIVNTKVSFGANFTRLLKQFVILEYINRDKYYALEKENF